MYMLKLHHLVDDKIHARSTGPYSLVTSDRWAVKRSSADSVSVKWRFGRSKPTAAYTLQEILTVKSDDIVGRVKTYEAIVKGENIPKPGIPESFKVLIKEMQALGLDVKVLSENDEEIEIKESSEYDDDLPNLEAIMDLETEMGSEEEVLNAGFSEELADDDEPSEDDLQEAEDFAFDNFRNSNTERGGSLNNNVNQDYELNNFESMKISLASPEKILEWSHGEVTKPETINYRTLKPEKDGLFCERIFGPMKDWECHCGSTRESATRGLSATSCGVEVTKAKVRRERMGHIKLVAPVSHIWYFKGIPSRMGLCLDVTPRISKRCCISPPISSLSRATPAWAIRRFSASSKYREAKEQYGDRFEAGMGAESIKVAGGN